MDHGKNTFRLLMQLRDSALDLTQRRSVMRDGLESLLASVDILVAAELVSSEVDALDEVLAALCTADAGADPAAEGCVRSIASASARLDRVWKRLVG